ncbi:ChaB family protein [Thiohalorhabdus methylotrophus]|uniref:ChaB family protein n=1 Tax=Thiohalorhabdus methylotrophus TaxID=3242694 RepID=A0ABV4TYT0_9GAMM
MEELPEQVRNNLPEGGQEVFKEAYNSAYEEYADPRSRRDPDEPREEVAMRVAWSMVKLDYTKNDNGEWVKKE